jgi:2-methylcitrate dehydratase PrpD
MTVAGQLAEFVTTTGFDSLPSLAVERAKMVIASTLASAAMGCEISSAGIIRTLARERGGTPDASVWFDAGPRLPIADVAQVNAVMSDAAASDDSDLRNIAHIGTIITSTSLASAERTGAGGRDILAAMVLGYEIAGRVGDVVSPGYGERGFHGGIVTIFGGAVATGLLLGLTAAQMSQAIALAATSIGGLGVAANTSLAREYDAGLAALLGVNAALAAGKGFVAEERILEMPRGFFESFGGRDVESITRNLGGEWDITTDMAIKLVPGAHPFHAIAEAAVNAARAASVEADEIESITVSGAQFAAIRGPVHPTDLIGVAHSLPYFLGAAVADREFSWVHATPEKMADPRIASLADKVRSGGVVPATPDTSRHQRGGTVTIGTKDGRQFSSTVLAPRGSGPTGIDWADVDAKYRALMPAAKLSAGQVEESLGVIHGFEQAGAAKEILGLLR